MMIARRILVRLDTVDHRPSSGSGKTGKSGCSPNPDGSFRALAFGRARTILRDSVAANWRAVGSDEFERGLGVRIAAQQCTKRATLLRVERRLFAFRREGRRIALFGRMAVDRSRPPCRADARPVRIGVRCQRRPRDPALDAIDVDAKRYRFLPAPERDDAGGSTRVCESRNSPVIRFRISQKSSSFFAPMASGLIRGAVAAVQSTPLKRGST
jgi:hypothetical protein